jgi:hypothetical protein
MITGSLQWQHSILVVCLVWLLVSLLRGWSNGLLRQLVLPFALLAAAAGVHFWLPWLMESAARATHLPSLFLFPVTFLVLWLLVYTVTKLVGHLVFKRTRDMDGPARHLAFGAGGAFIGLFYGLFSLWLLAIGLRVVGRLAQEQATLQESAANVFVRNLAKLDASIELGAGRTLLDAIDPVPAWIYRDVALTGRLLNDPQAIARFAEYPGFQAILQNPQLQALQNDPVVLDQARRGNLLGLLTNPKVLEVLREPDVQRQLSGRELETALRYAVNGS